MPSCYNVQTHPRQERGGVLIAIGGFWAGEEVEHQGLEASFLSAVAVMGALGQREPWAQRHLCQTQAPHGQEEAGGDLRHFAGGNLDVLAAKSCFSILQSLLSKGSQVGRVIIDTYAVLPRCQTLP